MTKHNFICLCGRPILFEGSVNRIEAALNDRDEPSVVDELEDLLTNSNREFRQRATDLAVVADIFCNAPHELRRNELNWLYEEIWEIKFGTMRLAFTSAVCAYVRPGARLLLAPHVKVPKLGTNTARATSLFVKQGERAPLSEIRRARAIAREDQKNESH